ncbi:MAG: lipase family protein [Chitinophagales bacterium]
MKRILYFFLAISLSMPSVSGQVLVSSELLQSLSTLELAGQGVFGATYGVDVYKLIYNTIDTQGEPTIASGAMVLPQTNDETLCFPMMSYAHGTVLAQDNIPSRLSGEILVGYFSAADGYVAVLPDYLGMGDSPGLHPYVHADSEATASIDMIRAAREYAAANNISLNDQLFLTGYSQGGHACMATHKMMQEQFPDEFTVTASSPGSGPYDLSSTSFDNINSDEAYSTGGYVPYLLFAYQSVYGNLYENVSDALKAPYDTTLPPLFDGTHAMAEVHAAVPAIPTEIFQDDYLEAIRTDENHPYRVALRDNDLYDWVPTAPVRMYYCEADEQVPFENSILALETMQANGAENIEAVSAGATFEHGACATFALFGSKGFFDEVKNNECVEVGIFTPSNDYLSLQIAPNPSSSMTQIRFDNPQQTAYEMTVTDISGKAVHFEENIHSSQVNFNSSELHSGIYLVELRGTQVYRGKMLVQN